MQADLRACLARLEAHERLLRVRRPVDPRIELAALITEAERRGRAILFESVVGSTMPVVANVVGGRRLLALGLGDYQHRSLREGKDLRGLPLVVHSEKDAAPYVTAGLVVAKDPETGIRNVSFNRMMLRGSDEVGIRMMPPQHLGLLYDRAGARGQSLPVAVAIGNHPAELVAGATTLAFGDDELGLAGALRGEPLELAKCVTVDVEVPARAEIVLEGEVLPGVAEPEGPYGDFMQFYIPVMANRVLRIHAITHRRDAIHQTMHAGQAEDTALLAVSREAQLLDAVRAAGADVREVSLLPTILAAAIAIRKRFEGEPKQVMAACFGRYRWLKLCVVVDEDVDALDVSDVWWAIATRSRLGDGVMHLTGVAGFPRDPHGLHTAKLGIDATVPLGERTEYERKHPPGHGRVRLDDFL